jgi:hypothetical protein
VTDTTAGDFLYITDVQLEPGTVATPFERRGYGQELALCQRYYYSNPSVYFPNGQASPVYYKVTMRSTPTNTTTASGTLSFTNQSVDGFTCTSTANSSGVLTASAEL